MLSFILAVVIATPALPKCAYDRTAMLALSFDQFDQDMKGGWRPLGDTPGCESIAADLLASYRDAHWRTLRLDQLHLNYFHEGQIRAFGGDYKAAAPLLMAGVDPDNDDIDFSDYAIGTVAFIEHDRQGLELARARLAKATQPSWWAAQSLNFKAKYGTSPAWPANSDVLDGLSVCFNQPYRQAYTSECRKPASK